MMALKDYVDKKQIIFYKDNNSIEMPIFLC